MRQLRLDRHRPGEVQVRVVQLGAAHQAGLCAEFGEPVEHQHPVAAPVGADLEAGAVLRERVGPGGPGLPGERTGPHPPVLLVRRPVRIRRHLLQVALVVVEHHLEQPVGRGDLGPHRPGGRVAVPDPGEVAVGAARAVALARPRGVDVAVVLGHVLVDDGVALVVVALADQPAEHAGALGDRAPRRAAVDRGDVVVADDAPVRRARLPVRPALDAGEQPLHARPVAVDRHPGDALLVHLTGAVRQQDGDQVLGAGQREDVGLGAALIARQPLVGPAGHRRQVQGPAESERAVSPAGVVTQLQGRPEPGAPRRHRNRNRTNARTGRRIGGELLTDPPDRSATLGDGYTGRRHGLGDGGRLRRGRTSGIGHGESSP